MRAGGFDPVECYKKNYVGEGDVYTWRDGRQWQAHSVNYVKAIEAAAEKFGWKDKWKGWGVPTWESEDGRFVRGVGCGIIGNADIGEDNTEAYVRVVPTSSVTRPTSCCRPTSPSPAWPAQQHRQDGSPR